MSAKVNLLTTAPGVMKVWHGASLAIGATLEPSLIELVKIHASQINACANCINMHTTEARSQGETEQRIYLLSAWREAPCYTERERAALAWRIGARADDANRAAKRAAYRIVRIGFMAEVPFIIVSDYILTNRLPQQVKWP